MNALCSEGSDLPDYVVKVCQYFNYFEGTFPFEVIEVNLVGLRCEFGIKQEYVVVDL